MEKEIKGNLVQEALGALGRKRSAVEHARLQLLKAGKEVGYIDELGRVFAAGDSSPELQKFVGWKKIKPRVWKRILEAQGPKKGGSRFMRVRRPKRPKRMP